MPRGTGHEFDVYGIPSRDAFDLPTSNQRFPDGAQYRMEIPSTESPRAFQLIVDRAKDEQLPIQRISQGSGIWLLTDDEIHAMATIGAREGMEVSLFVGPRAAWDTGAQAVAAAGKVTAANVRGADGLNDAVTDVRRACDLGIRSVLVADEGLLWLLGRMRRAGELPPDLIFKISVQMGPTNPASARLLEDLGADTINVATDLSLPQLAAIRQATSLPIDMYIEAPDDFGGFLRYYELPEIVRVAAPVYVKFGLRNAPNIYPWGTHLEATAYALTGERVRRARMAYDLLKRLMPEAITSERGAKGLGLPKPRHAT